MFTTPGSDEFILTEEPTVTLLLFASNKQFAPYILKKPFAVKSSANTTEQLKQFAVTVPANDTPALVIVCVDLPENIGPANEKPTVVTTALPFVQLPYTLLDVFKNWRTSELDDLADMSIEPILYGWSMAIEEPADG